MQIIAPLASYALTSGPTQPETKQFQSISASDMVDLSTGNFSYSIPLMDVGGYPITLSYSANNTGIEEEASNVGLGWNINVGAINRQLRGVADDFKGDVLKKKKDQLDFKNAEVGFSVNSEIVGFPLPFNLGAGLTVGWNNYWGYYGKFSLRPSLSASMGGGGKLTMGLSMESGSRDGVSLAPHASLSYNSTVGEYNTLSMGGSISAAYNTRQGLKSLTLGTDASLTPDESNLSIRLERNATLDFVGPTYYPQIDWPRQNMNYAFDFSPGPILGAHIKGTIRGAYSTQRLKSNNMDLKMYGSLYSNYGKNDGTALLDFTREKDGAMHRNTPNLPIPYFTPDIFSATNHLGSSQFTLKSASSGIFYDPAQRSGNDAVNGGVELGAGVPVFKFAANLGYINTTSTVGKWEKGNSFNNNGNFYADNNYSSLNYEPVYARKAGNLSAIDENYFNKIGKADPVKVDISSRIFYYDANQSLQNHVGQTVPNSNQALKRNKRESRDQDVVVLTAAEASKYSFTKNILRSYNINEASLANCDNNYDATIPRINAVRKPHHLSEIRVTNPDGKRLIYGIPAYNISQREVSFAINKPANGPLLSKGLVKYNKANVYGDGNVYGRDNFYQEDNTPAYAHSFLLTEVLSPDYVDVTNDGVTDDDHGEAIKFNYTRTHAGYGWRTPFVPMPALQSQVLGTTLNANESIANYSEGNRSDDMDDKASFVNGKKEIWNIHSIETKAFYALFIYDVDDQRRDMLGITPESDNAIGGIVHQQGLYRLKEIKLFAKADIRNNGIANAVPIKTVHFETDYIFSKNLPNAVDLTSGKLGLTSVYFTYGKNKKGRLAPYVFTYYGLDQGDPAAANKSYDFKLQDRWQNYKEPSQNPNGATPANPGGNNNWEYPYSIQDKNIADENITLWKLKKIELPSGGEINVQYEADDYAFVQNRRAMKMVPLAGIGNVGTSTGLIASDKFVITPPVAMTVSEFKKKYLEGQEFIFYKLLLDVDGDINTPEEYVQGYAKIKDVELQGSSMAIVVEKVENTNPAAFNGWQMLRMSLPQFAYEGYDNPEGGGLDGILFAIGSAFTTIAEIFKGFKTRAAQKNFSDKAVLEKSFIRLCDPLFKKIGGDHRVKQVTIDDKWQQMSSSGLSSTQTIQYIYTDENNFSTGVAAYEPILGNEENPFRQPILYTEKVPMALDIVHTLEEPMGESYFPSPLVVYQKVKVITLGDDGQNRTGHTVNEFYTAKEFPVIAKQTSMKRYDFNPSFILRLLNVSVEKNVGVSQGYSVEINDMHGKPKSVQVFDKAGAKTSAVYYHYKADAIGQQEWRLNNGVEVVDETGNVVPAQIGVDVDLFHDMRHEKTVNDSYEMQFNNETWYFGVFALNFFLMMEPPTRERTQFFGTSTIKLVNRTGILDRVVKMENGSQIESKNLLWDAENGEVVLTQTQNEFEDLIYNFHYPAHWAYSKMGGAYKNSGLVIEQFQTDATGSISNSVGLNAGDELMDISNPANSRYMWVSIVPGNVYKLIDADGKTINSLNTNIKVIRSSNRNLYNQSVGNIVSLQNPIRTSGSNKRIDIDAATQILNASAISFADEWAVPVIKKQVQVPCDCDPGYVRLTTLFPDADPNLCVKITNVLATPPNPSWQGCHVPNMLYGEWGAKIYSTYSQNGGGNTTPAVNTSYWNNRMQEIAIWRDCPDFSNNPPFQLSVPIFIPKSGTVFVGIMVDHYGSFSVDGQTYVSLQTPTPENYKSYRIYPVSLTAGVHRFVFNALNDNYDKAAIAAEIYLNSPTELIQADEDTDLDILFSTQWFINRPIGTYNCSSNAGIIIAGKYFYCRTYDIVDLDQQQCFECQTQENKTVNLYTTGLKGNWRPDAQWVYKENREQPFTEMGLVKNLSDIRRSGYLKTFTPFWSSSFQSTPANWIKSNEITLFNTHADEIENKNALGQYSSALYGFNNSLPVAVASNTRHNELAYEGFEDLQFPNTSCKTSDCENGGGPFKFRDVLLNNPLAVTISNTVSHTGMSSLKMTNAVDINNQIKYPATGNKYSFINGQTIMEAPGINWGFAPFFRTNEKYIFSAWVRDDVANRAGNTPLFDVDVFTNVSLQTSNPVWGPVIDGWRKVEVVVQNTGSNFNNDFFRILLQPNASLVYLDDLRFYPFDGQMKSFAYDSKTFKLMAELDENNYATFYEYDDEGSLIRVKKETERGIQTIKESRSSQRKKP